MTAAVRFRGRRKPLCVQRVVSAEIESESDTEVVRALHVRAIQRIRRQFCSTVVDDPEPALESKPTLLCHNFKPTEEKLSSSLGLQSSKRDRTRTEQDEKGSQHSDQDSNRKQRKVIAHPQAELDIEEYPLSIEAEIKNIEATEAAKRAAMKKLASAPSRGSSQNTSLNLIPVNIGCNFQQYENESVNGNIRYAASDEFVYQQFRKRVV